MKLISSYELRRHTEAELSALFGRVSKGLTITRRDTPERRNALASLENITRERRVRLAGPGF